MKPILKILALSLTMFLMFTGCGDDGDGEGSSSSDTTAPQTLSSSPGNGSTMVATNSTISVYFNEAIDASTATLSNIDVQGGSDTFTGDIEVYDTSITITPTELLETDTTYTVYVRTGIKDRAGNALDQESSFVFFTQSAPTYTTTPESSGTTNYNYPIYINFAQAMDVSTLTSENIILRDSHKRVIDTNITGDYSLTVTPVVHLEPGTNYTLLITTNIKDYIGNPLEYNTTIAFNTYEVSNYTSGSIVDPYIEGAVLCEDIDSSSTCDNNEILSSASNANGIYTFSGALTIGSPIIIKTQGTHNGKLYDLNISSVVVEGYSNNYVSIVSPLTTLIKTRASPDYAGLLSAAGLSYSSTYNNLLGNPMGDAIDENTFLTYTGSSVSDSVKADLNTSLSDLQASLAVYGLLRTMDSSATLRALTGTDFDSNVTNDGLLTVMITNVRSALSIDNLSTLNDTVVAAQSSNPSMPDATMGVVIKTATAVMTRLTEIAYDTASTNGGTDSENIAASIVAINTDSAAILANVDALNERFYGQLHSEALSSLTGLSTAIQVGVDNNEKTFIINSSNAIEAYSE